VEQVRLGGFANSQGLRSVLLQNQGDTVYDLRIIHYCLLNTSVQSTNEAVMMAVSTREEDQVEDLSPVGFDQMVTEEGIILPYAMMSDELTSGAVAMLGSQTITLPRAITVPFLAGIINFATANAPNVGIEVWFDRRRDLREKAQLVSRSGGRARTT